MIEKNLLEILKLKYDKSIEVASNEEIYFSLVELAKSKIKEREISKTGKKLYYISAEFLIGRLLKNNLINLDIYKEVLEVLQRYNRDFNVIEEIEIEPSLGNGGLGRLAACFLDSIATLGLNGDGIGLNYHFGLFKQVFKNHKQKAIKNPWINNSGWLNESNIAFEVNFKDFKVKSKLYNMDIIGFKNNSNNLHLFDIDTIDENIVGNGIDFDKKDIRKNLTLFLYPDDRDKEGQLLRIYQQYFMVSNAAQYILLENEKKGFSFEDLDKNIVIQINDTHPSMIIPELIRLLIEKGINKDKAIDIVSKTCAYTNHTILSEALEKWPISYIEEVAPQLIPIIKELDRRVNVKFKDESVSIVDRNNMIHMANLDIHYGFNVNGVAALHTEILKNEELNSFYNIYKSKFNNKTNGITFRRWLLSCNESLSSYIEELIGGDFIKDYKKLSKLYDYKDNKEVLKRIGEIKKSNKVNFKNYLLNTQNITIDENSIFDIQIKRFHEYKRQQMNLLYLIYKYLEIKKGNKPATSITTIFGGKAAPAYIIAQDVIHAILCLREVINNDEEANKFLKVVMIENYNVTSASKVIPACDVSEQISLASKEASGTGNMKFMLNGAITLGTEDGANVEIMELVGKDNIYIFGEKSSDVILHYKNRDYNSRSYYYKGLIKPLVDFIVSDEMISIGDSTSLYRLFNELINKDWFMTLLDLEDYIKVKEKVFKDYEDREAWNRKALINISKAGFFSSDRTIEEYNRDIWKL